MSLKWSKLVWNSDQPKGADTLCLLALADMANEQGICWPSHSTLARMCKVTTRSIGNRVKSLEAKGIVRVERRPGRSSKFHIVPVPLESSESKAKRSDQQEIAAVEKANNPQLVESITPENPAGGYEESVTTTLEPLGRGDTSPSSEEPIENHQIEPTNNGFVGEKEKVVEERLISQLASQLERLGVLESDLKSKLAGLISENGAQLVEKQIRGLIAQYSKRGVKIGFGLVRAAVANPDAYKFAERASDRRLPRIGPPVPGTYRDATQVARLIKEGMAGENDWERVGFLFRYVPQELRG